MTPATSTSATGTSKIPGGADEPVPAAAGCLRDCDLPAPLARLTGGGDLDRAEVFLDGFGDRERAFPRDTLRDSATISVRPCALRAPRAPARVCPRSEPRSPGDRICQYSMQAVQRQESSVRARFPRRLLHVHVCGATSPPPPPTPPKYSSRRSICPRPARQPAVQPALSGTAALQADRSRSPCSGTSLRRRRARSRAFHRLPARTTQDVLCSRPVATGQWRPSAAPRKALRAQRELDAWAHAGPGPLCHTCSPVGRPAKPLSGAQLPRLACTS